MFYQATLQIIWIMFDTPQSSSATAHQLYPFKINQMSDYHSDDVILLASELLKCLCTVR